MAVPERQPAGRTPAAWEPWEDLQRTMNRLYELAERTFADLPTAVGQGGFVPAADLEETDDAYLLEVELPGMRKQDVKVETQGRRITVSGVLTVRVPKAADEQARTRKVEVT